MPDLVYEAVWFRKLEMVKILLEAGCSPDKNPDDRWSMSPLPGAISKLPEAMDILIDGELTNPFHPFIL